MQAAYADRWMLWMQTLEAGIYPRRQEQATFADARRADVSPLALEQVEGQQSGVLSESREVVISGLQS